MAKPKWEWDFFFLCPVFPELSQWSFTSAANTRNKTFSNWPLLRRWQKNKTIVFSKMICGRHLWCTKHLAHISKPSIIPKVLSCYATSVCKLNSPRAHWCSLTETRFQTHVWSGAALRVRVGDSLMNLFCMASSRAWWASSDCTAAEHSRASMVRIRCSPQPDERQSQRHARIQTWIIYLLSIVSLLEVNLTQTRSPTRWRWVVAQAAHTPHTSKNPTRIIYSDFKTLAVYGINHVKGILRRLLCTRICWSADCAWSWLCFGIKKCSEDHIFQKNIWLKYDMKKEDIAIFKDSLFSRWNEVIVQQRVRCSTMTSIFIIPGRGDSTDKYSCLAQRQLPQLKA